MDESEENMSSEDTLLSDSSQAVKPKPKKKSLVERELETNLTARITSPVLAGDGCNTSRYGRARRSKANDSLDNTTMDVEQKPALDQSLPQSPVYKMHASNSPIRSESAKKGSETFLDSQIESIYQENISLSRFSKEEKPSSSSKQYPKVYIRKDLLQNKEPEEDIPLIKNMFPSNKSGRKSSTHLNNILERSSERYNISKKQKYIDKLSVVKTLDFDSKKKKENTEKVLSKSELFEMEAQSPFQVGDLAWARMGTYPFWPCIVTREPSQGIFIRKKLFGRITRDIIHVTFFGDNGRRGWIVDLMLRKYLGQLEFETARENFTAEDKKRDPKLYAAYFTSEKKRAQWNTAVEESETLYKEPKRLRIDIFNEMLQNTRIIKPKNQKSGKISRTGSDVSLSESLYDSLFSEDDGKGDNEKSKRPRNKSLDMFEVVTACLDDMAARTGIPKIQKQSHMDRWLQKAKSKTPEKFQGKSVVKKKEPKESKNNSKSKKVVSEVPVKKNYGFRKVIEPPTMTQEIVNLCDENINSDLDNKSVENTIPETKIEVIPKDECVSDKDESNEVPETKNDLTSDSQENIDISWEPEVKIERNDDFDSNSNNMNEQEQKFDTSSIETPSRSDTRRSLRSRRDKLQEYSVDNPEFLKYLEMRQDLLLDENPDLSEEEIVAYLFKTWLYEQTVNDDKDCIDLTETMPVKKPSRPRDRDRERDRNRDRSRKSKKKSSKRKSKKSINTEENIETTREIKAEMLNDAAEIDTDTSQILNDTTLSSNITNCDSSLDLSQENDHSSIENKSEIEDVNTVDAEVNNTTEDNKYIVEQNTKLDELTKDKIVRVNIERMSIDTEHFDSEPKNISNDDSKMSTNDEVSEEDVPLEPQNTIKLKENEVVEQNIHAQIENSVSEKNISLETPLVNGYKENYDKIEREDTIQKEMDAGDVSVYEDSDSDIVLPYSPLTDHEDLDDVGQKHFAKKTEGKIINRECSPTFTERQSDTEKCSPDNSLNLEENKLSNAEKSIENCIDDNISIKKVKEKSLTEQDIGKWINNVSPEIDDELNEKFHKVSKRDVTEIDISDNKEVHINFTNTIKENGYIHVNGDISPKNIDKKLKHLKANENVSITSEMDINNTSMDSEDSVSSTYSENKHRLRLRREKSLRNKTDIDINSVPEENSISAKKETKLNLKVKQDKAKQISEPDFDTLSINSEDSVSSTKSETRRKLRSKKDKTDENPLENPGFVKYLEMRQDAVMDENPELSHEEIVLYLHKTWLYEENAKSDEMKNNELLESNLVKGLHKSPIKKKNLSLSKNNLHKYIHKKEIVKEQSRKTTRTKSTDSENKMKDIDVKSNGVSSTVENIEPDDKKPLTSDLPVTIKKDTNSFPNEVESIEITKEESKDSISNDKEVLQAVEVKSEPVKIELKDDLECESIDSEDSETPLIQCKLRAKSRRQKIRIKEEDTMSINSEDSEVSTKRKKKRKQETNIENSMNDPEFVKYLELRQDTLIDEHPELTHDEIVSYLYKTWLYEESNKSELKKNDDKVQSTLVKGLEGSALPKKIKRHKIRVDKENDDSAHSKDKPKRTLIQPYYNEEEFSDIEEELEVFEIFRKKYKPPKPLKTEKDDQPVETLDLTQATLDETEPVLEETEIIEVYDNVDLYFKELTKPKPNIFKGLLREKVCEICEKTERLVKCKGCNGMFHVDCVQNELAEKEEAPVATRGRKKKKKVRKLKSIDGSDNDKSQDGSEENNLSIEDESHVVDADTFEAQLAIKMKEILENTEPIEYEIPTSEDELLWNDIAPGKCEIIDAKLKPIQTCIETSDFKCNNCQKYDTPICFVCKSAISKKDIKIRQKCSVGHCNKFYHLDCLDQWPQTQFNGGGPSKNNKKVSEHFEAVTCPRHVCHTCVCDDPRGCKTRFSGDKLARCVRCPATYHSFTKCLPAGSQILSASQIVCPRHTETRPGKVPCHVNTGWCFICALGGSLICCEYCPTSFHAECLNIKPPEGGYMCEDCETGRLPLYGEMVWVKLGHYRWWPGIILHPTEIPENILAVKHSPGDFVVRFFGQYDHYWVNRGRVFPFQEGDSGRISSQKSKIDAAFTTAMEHACRACEILKNAKPNEEESLDIASSLLPPHYVKLRVNKAVGALCGRKLDDPESSLTQCECNPLDDDVCGPYSHCLNRMLLTECGPTCRAGDRCNNRAFERRSYPKLVPYRTPSRGWGLKTLEHIRPGQFVIEYVGELIDEEEFRHRMKRKHEIRDENYYFLTLDKDRMIDAGPKGNLARFMNHCCEPNCETQKWTVLGDVRVGLFAITDIPANSEVTFNYNLECAGIEKKRCMCGAKRCSGYIGAKPKQDESQSKKNKLQPKRTYKKKKPTELTPPTTKKLGRPRKQRELTEIEKDLLIIKNATNSASSDDSCVNTEDSKGVKRKASSPIDDGQSESKRSKVDEKCGVGD